MQPSCDFQNRNNQVIVIRTDNQIWAEKNQRKTLY
jgi:hypothetical protein